jgi:hypothetical protein
VNDEGRRWYKQNMEIKEAAMLQKQTEIGYKLDFKSEEHNYTRIINYMPRVTVRRCEYVVLF